MSEDKKEEIKNTPRINYAEAVENKKEEVKKRAFKKAEEKSAVKISQEERNWAEQTHTLMTDPRFKTYLELENLEIVQIMTTAYLPPPEAAFKSNKFGEQMAFKAGMDYAIKRLKGRRESMWLNYLNSKKQELNDGPNENDKI